MVSAWVTAQIRCGEANVLPGHALGRLVASALDVMAMSAADRAHHKRERRILAGLAVVAVVYTVGDAWLGGCTGALHLVPLLALLLPLLLGRYVGESILDRLRRRRPPIRRVAAVVMPRPARSDRAVARVLRGLARACRPPPAFS
jgi:hypothetical protein